GLGPRQVGGGEEGPRADPPVGRGAAAAQGLGGAAGSELGLGLDEGSLDERGAARLDVVETVGQLGVSRRGERRGRPGPHRRGGGGGGVWRGGGGRTGPEGAPGGP